MCSKNTFVNNKERHENSIKTFVYELEENKIKGTIFFTEH